MNDNNFKNNYLLRKGFVIDIAVKIIWGCAIFVLLTITCVAMCYSTKHTNKKTILGEQ